MPLKIASGVLVAACFLACSKIPFARSPRVDPFDSSKLYAYLVTSAYPDTLAPDRRREIGHGVFAALVIDHGGLVSSVTSAELRRANLTLDEA